MNDEQKSLPDYQWDTSGYVHMKAIHVHIDRFNAVETKLAKAIRFIENAPHANSCGTNFRIYPSGLAAYGSCDCWKADALKELK